jgi:hypothetical protein
VITTSAQQRRQRLYGLLGDLPPRDRPPRAELVRREERQWYTLDVLSLDLNGLERAPAYFTSPLDVTAAAPAVVYNHAHRGDYVLGKDELLVGRPALQQPPYAEALARRGMCCLCIDAWNFGERRGRTESELFKELLWRGQVQDVNRETV